MQNKKWFCATLFHYGHLLFTWKTHCGLKFHFGQFDRSEICTEVSFTTPEVMWTLIMKLPHTEVKFYPEVKFQTGLISFWGSCRRFKTAQLTNKSKDRQIELINTEVWRKRQENEFSRRNMFNLFNVKVI